MIHRLTAMVLTTAHLVLTSANRQSPTHCALPSDADALERSLEWLDEIGVSPAPYVGALDVLSDGPLSRATTDLHVYLGVGVRQGAVYSTFYLNPAGGIV